MREGRVLNRVIRWTEDGWETEPDQRHVDILVKELGWSEARPVSTPGENQVINDHEDEPLSDPDASRYRALAARENYLSADRTDFVSTTKEI